MVLHVDHVGGLAGGFGGVCDNECYRIADMANTILRQRETWRHDHWCDSGDLSGAGQGTELVGRQIGGGEYAVHPGGGARGGGVYRFDRRMRVRRAQNGCVQHVGQGDVVE